MDKAKIDAATKMAWGAARIASGVVTATGHGVLGTACRNHHQMRLAVKFGAETIKKGVQTFRDGLDDWNRAQNPPAAKTTIQGE